MYTFRIQLSKYVIVGAGNFFVTFLVFTVFLKVLEFHYLISLGFSWLVGVFFSYMANFFWVFRPSGDMRFRERFLFFGGAGLVSLVVNMFALAYVVNKSGLDSYLAQLALTPFVVMFNFVAAKFLAFKSA